MVSEKMDTLNFSAGIEKDNLSISLYGQNINDDEYLTTAFVAVTDFTKLHILVIQITMQLMV